MVGNRIDNLSAPVSAGWNLVGSISDPIPVSTNLCLFPAGNAFTSQFFTYKNGYVRVDSIIPGIGLWVKVQSAGSILMNSSPIQCDAPSAISEDGLDHFIITDSQGKKQDLYVANLDLDPSLGQTDLSMPPPFPEAGFDARFEDGEFIKPVSPDSGIVQLVINVEAQAYPVTVNWELNPANGIEYSITSEGMGKQPSGQHLSRAGSTTMTTLSGGKLRLGVQASHSGQQTIPKAYVLAQNYPNPFNPTTEIRFGLPDAGTVSLVVYDVLGRKVAELANGYHAAGYHNATWNAVGAASGVYFARFSVTSTAGAVAYTKVNKLMLIR